MTDRGIHWRALRCRRLRGPRSLRDPFLLPSAVFLLAFLAMGLVSVQAASRNTRLDPKTLLRHHMEAVLGSRSALPATRTASGQLRIQVIQGGSGYLEGPARFVAAENRLHYLGEFDHPTYDREEFAYDGRRARIGFHAPGAYSQLGNFLNVYSEILGEGLLGGVLSISWPLLDENDAASRLRYQGLKRIRNEEVHEVDYRMRRGRNLRVKMYFELETFLHVGTTYEVRTPAAQMGPTPDTTPGQRPPTFRLEETFAEFERFDGQMLPRRWLLQLTIDSGASSVIWEWRTSYHSMEHDVVLSDEDFGLRQ
jgi:hypothetical protein